MAAAWNVGGTVGLTGPFRGRSGDIDPFAYDAVETRWESIGAIGDAIDVPASKAGMVAHRQADLVAHNPAARLRGKGQKRRF